MYPFIVYALCETNGEVRYIGKSCSGMKRPLQHFNPCFLRHRSHKNTWIRSRLKAGARPIVVVLEECDSAGSVAAAEVRLIASYRAVGARLTNGTNGGDGGRTTNFHPRIRPVEAISAETGEVVYYRTVQSTKLHGFAPTKVVATCKGRDGRVHHRGWRFRYAKSERIRVHKAITSEDPISI